MHHRTRRLTQTANTGRICSLPFIKSNGALEKAVAINLPLFSFPFDEIIEPMEYSQTLGIGK